MELDSRAGRTITGFAWAVLLVLILTWTGVLEHVAYVSAERDWPIVTGLTSPWYPDLLDYPPCEHEDGGTVLPCYWDGGPNGTGDTYVVTTIDGELSYIYGDASWLEP